jgi:hypothetical protein
VCVCTCVCARVRVRVRVRVSGGTEAVLNGGQRWLGQDAYIELPPRTVGGTMSVCVWVQLKAFTNWERIIDFGVHPAPPLPAGAGTTLCSVLA